MSEERPNLSTAELGALLAAAASGLLQLDVRRPPEGPTPFIGAVSISSFHIRLLVDTPDVCRDVSFAEVREIIECVATDPDVLKVILHRWASTRDSYLHRIGYSHPPTMRADRQAWYALLDRTCPWDPLRFSLKVREVYRAASRIGARGTAVKEACVRFVECAMPWPRDDAERAARASFAQVFVHEDP